jgi:hypothetical protein
MRLVVAVNLGDFLFAQDRALLVTIPLYCRYVACLPGFKDLLIQLDQAINLRLLYAGRHISRTRVLSKLGHSHLR